jgi:hypothetical protein
VNQVDLGEMSFEGCGELDDVAEILDGLAEDLALNTVTSAAVNSVNDLELPCDPSGPLALQATTGSPTNLVVTFNQAVDGTAAAPADFSFAGGSLSASSIGVSGSRLTLVTTPQVAGLDYTLTLSPNLKSASGETLGIPQRVTFKGYSPPP